MDIIWTRAYARIIIYNRIDVKGRSVVAGEPKFSHITVTPDDEDARPKREKAGNEGYRETTMDDLKAAPMPLAQKVVLALAAVGVVAIVAWYLFLR